MRISLIHGEDTAKAYARFRDLVDGSKAKGFEIIQISDPKDIVSQSLFENKTVFTLEANKRSLSLRDKVKPGSWKWLAKNAEKYNSNLLIYYSGISPAGVLKMLPKDVKRITRVTVERFDLPKIIFSFLDSFNLKTFNELVKIEPVELVFHLLARRLRDLYWIKTDPKSIEMNTWQKSKLVAQSSKFEIQNLRLIINELAEIDIKSKTSKEDLKTQLDFLIMTYLQ